MTLSQTNLMTTSFRMQALRASEHTAALML